MDRETLIEYRKAAWVEYARLWKALNVRPSKADFSAGFDVALSLLQWKDVADGLPEVSGEYNRLHSRSNTRIREGAKMIYILGAR